MTHRHIKRTVTGHATVDGAGVHLIRVLGTSTVEDYDPFLMLDSFDSKNPEDYIKGFPFHPHRGIETITYLIQGKMEHRDSLGNSGVIGPGQSQWMTAGSGILHEELPIASERMLGVQIWLNLPKVKKMVPPHYFDIKESMIGQSQSPDLSVRVIAGNFRGLQGVKPSYVQATLIDFHLPSGRKVEIETKKEENVFIFLIEGPAETDNRQVPQKTAILYGPGDSIEVKALDEQPSRFLFFSGPPLKEPVAWGGPIVMNTQEELQTAFNELDEGNFIKK